MAGKTVASAPAEERRFPIGWLEGRAWDGRRAAEAPYRGPVLQIPKRMQARCTR
jgi:hypothetical protein